MAEIPAGVRHSDREDPQTPIFTVITVKRLKPAVAGEQHQTSRQDLKPPAPGHLKRNHTSRQHLKPPAPGHLKQNHTSHQHLKSPAPGHLKQNHNSPSAPQTPGPRSNPGPGSPQTMHAWVNVFKPRSMEHLERYQSFVSTSNPGRKTLGTVPNLSQTPVLELLKRYPTLGPKTPERVPNPQNPKHLSGTQPPAKHQICGPKLPETVDKLDGRI